MKNKLDKLLYQYYKYISANSFLPDCTNKQITGVAKLAFVLQYLFMRRITYKLLSQLWSNIYKRKLKSIF